MIPSSSPSSALKFYNPQSAGFTDSTGRAAPVSPVITPGERTLTIGVEGQSLFGDHCQALWQPTSPKVQSVWVMGDGLLRPHAEPGPGPTWSPNGYQGWPVYGSMIGRIGQRLIDLGATDRVRFCNVAYGGASAYQLSPSGELGHRLPLCFAAFGALGIRPSGVDVLLSHLGETDASVLGTSSATFQAQRKQSISVARNLGFNGPWLMANSTWVNGVFGTSIQAAIAALIADPTLNVRAGANSDNYVGSSYRYAEIDGRLIHPNMAGLIAITDDWVAKIRTALGI